MAQARFSIRTAVAEGFDFWRSHWTKSAAALGVAAAAYAFYQFAFATSASPGVILLGMAVYILATLAAQATYLRIALNLPEGPGKTGGLQWKALEGRLLIVGLLSGAAYAIAVFIAMFMGVVLLMGISERVPTVQPKTFEELLNLLSPNGQLVILGAMAVAMVALVILWARLSLASVSTAAEERVRVFSSTPLTKGLVLPIVATRFLIEMPVLLLQITGGEFGRFLGDPAAGVIAQIMAGMIGIFFMIAIDVGALAYIYRRVTATQGAA